MEIDGYRIHEWGGRLQWESFRIPDPGAGEALIQVEACGIGLTVLNCIRGDLGREPALLPRVPGHEIVGRVVEVGSGVEPVVPGQRVVVFFYLTCGSCHICLSGKDSLCANLAGFVGVHRDGGYAPYAVLPSRNLLSIPESLPPAAATAIPDAIATPLHVCKTQARVRPGDRVAVIGAGGGVGIHMVQMARLFGAEVIGLEKSEEKFEAIERAGGKPLLSRSFRDVDTKALWNGRRPSVVIDAVGTPESLSWALEALATGGRMIVLTTFQDVSFSVEPRKLVLQELALMGSRYASKAEVVEATELVERGLIEPVVSRAVPPQDIPEVHLSLREGTLIGRGAVLWGMKN